MYELKRGEQIIEQLKIGEEVITIRIKPLEIAKAYHAAEVDIVKAQDAIRAAGPTKEALEQYGAAIIKLFEVLFGQENTEKILTFYENNYEEMCLEVFPFIVDVLKPQLDKVINTIRQRTRDTYKKAKYGAKYNLGDRLFRK